MEDPQDEIEAIAEPIEEATIRLIRPDLLPSYSEEKKRHKEAKRTIDRAAQLARGRLRRLFGPVRERIAGEIEERHDQQQRKEDERHRQFLDGIRALIRAGGHSQAS